MSGAEISSIRRLESGYWHIRGYGPCNWSQPAEWPCDPEKLDDAFFGEAGAAFRRAVHAENERLLEGAS